MWPFRKRTPEEYLFKLYKKNETLETIGDCFFRKISIEERKRLSKYMLDLARIKNPNKRLRTKAIAALFEFAWIDKYEGIEFPADEVVKIISENIEEFLGNFRNTTVRNEDIIKNMSFLLWISSIIKQREWKIGNQLFRDFYDTLFIKSNLGDKYKSIPESSRGSFYRLFTEIKDSELYK